MPADSADEKLTKQQRADMAFRYLDWLLTKNVPSGGFRLLYAITQCFNEENQFHCFPSIEYLAARIKRAPSTVWEMVPKLEKIGVIEVEWGSQGSGDPNRYQLPTAFLEFYFGPEKGRQPKLVLPPKKPRQTGVSKPRRAGVSDTTENPGSPSEKPRFTEKKPRPAGESYFLATGDSHKKERGSAARSADDARESASSSTSSDAPITATDGPVARTAHAALKQPLAEQEQPPPCRATSRKMERPVNADPAEGRRWVQFLNVVSAWPQDHVGDEVSAYAVFSRIMGAGRSLRAVIDAVKGTRLDYDDDFPSLTSVLLTMERNP